MPAWAFERFRSGDAFVLLGGRQRAKTASPIKVSGTPRSQAEITVHLPGAFLPGRVEDQVDHGLLGLRIDDSPGCRG